MKYIKHGVCALLSLLLILTLPAGCVSKKSLQVSIALTGVPGTTDPAMVSSDAEKTVVNHLYENLLRFRSNAEGGITESGAVAKSWKEATNEDGSVRYTFTLRNDVMWSDGRTVTAPDFVYAWQRLVDPETDSPNAALLDMVAGYSAARKGNVSKLKVSAPDDFTLEVVLSHPCPYFLSAICTAAATMPVREEDSSLTNGAYAEAAHSENSLQLQAVSNFYDSDRIGPDLLTFTFCAAAEDTAKCWEDGTCDVALGLPASYTETAQPRQQVAVVVVNQMAKKMASETLCSAMSQVIDRNALAETLGVLPAAGLIPTGIPNTQGEDFRTHSGDILDNQAEDYAKLCQTAQQSLADDGVDPAKLGTVNLFCEDTPAQQSIAAALQQVWQAELGFTVKLVPMSSADLHSALDKGEFTLALTTASCDRRDATGYLNAWRSGNYANFHSSAFDMLLRAANNSQSAEARDAYLEDAERLLLDKGRVIPLYYDLTTRMVSSDLTGLIQDGLGTYDLRALHTAG